jgi:NhaP-type Na+/H+ or K+/H+ antiporter
MGISTEGKLFMGWFGPRGLASIVFAVIVVEAGVPNSGVIAATAVCTIMLSIIFHGITANPWAKGFGERFTKKQRDLHPGN